MSFSTIITLSEPCSNSVWASGRTFLPISTVVILVSPPSWSAKWRAGVSSSIEGRAILPFTTSAHVSMPLLSPLRSTASSPVVSASFLAFSAFFSSLLPPFLMLSIRESTSCSSFCPLHITIGGRSDSIFSTPATIVGEPLIPMCCWASADIPMSSTVLIFIVALRALMAPISDGLRGLIPVGVNDITHGIGSFSIWYPPSMIRRAVIVPSSFGSMRSTNVACGIPRDSATCDGT